MGTVRNLSIDIETYSDVDLSKCGVYKYVEGDFHILLFAYAFDEEEVKIVDMACGEELPQEILDAMECGSGDYCNVSVNFYAFNANGNRGIAAGLGNIQLIKHGERLAGKASAASDFEEIEGEEDAAGAFGGEDDLPDYLK